MNAQKNGRFPRTREAGKTRLVRERGASGDAASRHAAAVAAGPRGRGVSRPLVKICGVTSLADAELGAGEGADLIGLNFAPGSRRRVDISTAVAIADGLRRAGFDTRIVGVFVDASAEEIRAAVDRVGMDLIQLHGVEPPDLLDCIPVPCIKVFHVGASMPATSGYERAGWFLYDTFRPAAAGGTGERFDWRLLPPRGSTPFFVAGGLTAANVAAAIHEVDPDGVDVASGVERSIGVKDRHKVRAFLRSARKER